MDAVDLFYSALHAQDLDQLEACVLPDFKMVVPQKPERGFLGRDQEIRNMRQLFEAYPTSGPHPPSSPDADLD